MRQTRSDTGEEAGHDKDEEDERASTAGLRPRPEPSDGARVLVDRIWPRGLTKVKADLDEWCKEVAPSTELRKWYSHDPARFKEFTRRYYAELKQPRAIRRS